MAITVGIITISDRATSGEYDDLGGPALKAAAEANGWQVHSEAIVPDELPRIARADIRLTAARIAVAERTARLDQRRAPLAALLAGLATMGRRPPLLALADTGSVRELVRVRAASHGAARLPPVPPPAGEPPPSGPRDRRGRAR